jgi:hypothetical protein
MELSEKYTTNDKIAAQEADTELDPKEKTEKTKTILSNDSFAVAEILNDLKNSVLSTLRSFAR